MMKSNKGKAISFENNQLKVPNNPIIPFIEGDGIGPDIWVVVKRVLDVAVKIAYSNKRKINWYEIYAGEKAFKKFNEFLPKETLELIKKYYVAIKGPLTTPVGKGFRSLNVTLRQKLDLYTCLRPVQYFEGISAVVKNPENVNMTVFRENTEDIYMGIEWASETTQAKKLIKFLQEEMKVKSIRFPETSGIGVKIISKEGTERLVRSAIKYAIKHKNKNITLVHKGNIMKFTEGGFKNWGYDLAEKEFFDKVFTWAQYDKIKEKEGKKKADEIQDKELKTGKILIKDIIADAFLQQILTRPKEYEIIATTNLNGDYISDALAAQVGGIGIAPGANINYETGTAIFEATHGTAPKYAGLDKVNPSSLLLSGVLMLRYIGWEKAAELIMKSFKKTIKNKTVTYDLARLMENSTKIKCSEFGKKLIEKM